MRAKQKDIVLLPYPFTDQVGSKVKPGIIVSNESYNHKCQDYVLIPLTTTIKDEPYSVTINQSDLKSGILKIF